MTDKKAATSATKKASAGTKQPATATPAAPKAEVKTLRFFLDYSSIYYL